MSDRFFLDTNVFVYSFDDAAPKKAIRANELIRSAVDSRRGITSNQVVQEFFNVALRRFVQPMTIPDAEQYLATTFRPLLAVHSSIALYAEALRLSSRYHCPWYDSLILAAALAGRSGILYSEDFQHGQRFEGLRVENPFR